MTLPANPRVVVTGAGSGLGRAFCRQLAKRGARILAADINLAAAEQTVRELAVADAHAMACDVADPMQVAALADAMNGFYGGTDLLINNAGVAVAGQVGDVSLVDWEWILDVNLRGVIHGCHVFLPRFRAQGSGSVINVASLAGLVSTPRMAPYNTVKAAVVALSETLAADFIHSPITVSVLCPSFFPTEIGRNARGTEQSMTKMVDKLMAKSKHSADDVARIALDGVNRGDLYILPHTEGQWIWRMKRAAPESFPAMLSRFVKLAERFK